ncbi:hypothetical protein DFH09DRAFT_1196134 [Mycena vulgaris]|nr:hypothetical protein DFH09DRAFT_1196134 [Mycena vulgaris]
MHYVPVSRLIVLFGVSRAFAETTIGCPQTDRAGLPLQGLLDDPKDGTCPASLIFDGDGNGAITSGSKSDTTALPSLPGGAPTSRAPSSSLTVESTSFSIPDSTHGVSPGQSSNIAESTIPGLSSRTSLGGSTTTSASSAEKTPTGGQTVPSSVGTGSVRKSSLSGGIIAGISVGAATLLVLVVFLILCRRRHKRSQADLNPVVYPELALVPGPPVGIAAKTQGLREQRNSGGMQERDTESTLSSRTAGTRQEYLRNKILAAQRILDALPGVAGNFSGTTHAAISVGEDQGALGQARQQIQALQERIHTLESQLQSQWALGLSDEPPPGYLE